jgi:hypothetical protein
MRRQGIEKRSMGGKGYGNGRKGVFKSDAPGSQPVQIRCFRFLGVHISEMISPHSVQSNENYIVRGF